MGVPVFRASKITIFAQGFARFSRPFLLAGAWLSIMIERRYLLVLCANMHRASFLSTKKTQFRRGAKVGSRKRGYQSTEQLAKGMVQLHLAREREMKTSKRRVAKISVVVEPKGSAFFRVSKNFFADFQPHFLSVR